MIAGKSPTDYAARETQYFIADRGRCFRFAVGSGATDTYSKGLDVRFLCGDVNRKGLSACVRLNS